MAYGTAELRSPREPDWSMRRACAGYMIPVWSTWRAWSRVQRRRISKGVHGTVLADSQHPICSDDFGDLLVVFVMARATGDPVALLASDQATTQDIAQQLGLNQTLPIQYWVFFSLQECRTRQSRQIARRQRRRRSTDRRATPAGAEHGHRRDHGSRGRGRDTWIDKSMRVLPTSVASSGGVPARERQGQRSGVRRASDRVS